MAGLIYFIVYTAVAVVPWFLPSGRGWFYAAAVILSTSIMCIKVTMAYRFYYYSEVDEIHYYNLGDILDLPDFHIKSVNVISTIAAVSGIASMILFGFRYSLAAITVLYVTTVAINYAYPILRFIIRRVWLYVSLRRKGCRLSSGLLGLLVSGIDRIYYFTVTTPVKTYKVGVLGGIGETRYTFDGGKVTRQRVNPILCEHVIELETTETPIWRHAYIGIRYTRIQPTEADAELLIIPDNVFIIENGKLLSLGDRVLGNMNIVDIMRASKYISTMTAGQE